MGCPPEANFPTVDTSPAFSRGADREPGELTRHGEAGRVASPLFLPHPVRGRGRGCFMLSAVLGLGPQSSLCLAV